MGKKQFPPVSSSRGAPMGRADTQNDGSPSTLRLFPIRMVDGCYDSGGAYWGGPDTIAGRMYCARNLREGVEIFVRALDRAGAIKAVTEKFPAALFLPPRAPAPFHPDQKIPAGAWEAAQGRADIGTLAAWVKWIEEDGGPWPVEELRAYVRSAGIERERVADMGAVDVKAYALWIAAGQVESLRPGQTNVWIYLGE